MAQQQLTAPFPYFGGKRRWAGEILPRLGNPGDFGRMVYVEPFAGSLAILLANPTPFGREVVCDIDGHIVNFWRAMQADADTVAAWADYPTFHDDLTARHLWLLRWGAENGERVKTDADFYDPKAAGWWAWGKSNWIGKQWCDGVAYGDGQDAAPSDTVPHHSIDGGQGLQRQRRTMPSASIPVIPPGIHGIGVTAQRRTMPSASIPVITGCIGGRGVTPQRAALYNDKMPHINSVLGAKGVAAQKASLPKGDVGTGARLLPWFRALQQRLSNVIVLNRPWESAVTPNTLLLGRTPGHRIRVILDPPYRMDTGRDAVYPTDDTATDVAIAAYDWAVKHGDKIGVVYFSRDGDFPQPAGWTRLTQSLVGSSRGVADVVYLSPMLEPRGQTRLMGV